MIPEGKSYSILLIKKNLEDFHFLKKSLEGNSLFPSRIDLAANFEEALLKIKQHPYHLLLMESEVEEETRAQLEEVHAKRLPVPFILMLPIKDDSLLKQAMRCGVADVIVKSESQFHELAELTRAPDCDAPTESA